MRHFADRGDELRFCPRSGSRRGRVRRLPSIRRRPPSRRALLAAASSGGPGGEHSPLRIGLTETGKRAKVGPRRPAGRPGLSDEGPPPARAKSARRGGRQIAVGSGTCRGPKPAGGDPPGASYIFGLPYVKGIPPNRQLPKKNEVLPKETSPWPSRRASRVSSPVPPLAPSRSQGGGGEWAGGAPVTGEGWMGGKPWSRPSRLSTGGGGRHDGPPARGTGVPGRGIFQRGRSKTRTTRSIGRGPSPAGPVERSQPSPDQASPSKVSRVTNSFSSFLGGALGG